MADAMQPAPTPAAGLVCPKCGKGWMATALIFILLFALAAAGAVFMAMQTSANQAQIISLSDQLSGRNDEIMALQELLTAAQDELASAQETISTTSTMDTTTGELLATYQKIQDGGAPTIEKIPAGTVNLGDVPYNICPPNADGPCGFAYTIWADTTWRSLDQATYYFEDATPTGTTTYGPFEGNVQQIERDVRLLKAYAETL